MWKRIFVGASASVLLGGLVLAQIQRDPVRPRRVMRENQTTASSSMEQTVPYVQEHIAKCLLLGKQAEVVMAEFAAQHAQSPEVKEYVQLLTKNSTSVVSELRQIAPPIMTTEQLADRVSKMRAEYSARRPSKNINPEMADDPQQSPMMNNPSPSPSAEPYTVMRPTDTASKPDHSKWDMFTTIQHKTVENCICMTEDELSQSPKEHFDQCFLYQQIGANIGMIAHLRAVEPYVSGNLKTIVTTSEKTAQNNLNQAKNLLKNLQNKTASTSGTSKY
jgi:hypothetical protein